MCDDAVQEEGDVIPNSEDIRRAVEEALKPLPPQRPLAIVLTCRHAGWHPIKQYCLDCHITRETLFFRPSAERN